MLGLSKKTEVKKQLYKNNIYSKFDMNNSSKEKFDEDIKKITIVNEISSFSTNIEKGKNVESFFVVNILLKQKKFDEKNIILISNFIKQNMLFVLEYEEHAKLALYHKKIMQTEWTEKANLKIELKGLNLDSVWENIVAQIGNIEVNKGKTLDEQIEIDDYKAKLKNKTAILEKQAKNEKQPSKKFEIFEEIKKLKIEVEKNG